MHQVFGRISIQTQKAALTIHQPKATQTIEQPKAEMTVERKPAQVRIDQTEAWHNLNLKSARVRIAEAADAGKQAVLEGIARRARDGNELLHIERNKGKNLIAKQAADHVVLSVIGTRYETGSTPPFQAVRYDVVPGSLKINWQTHKPIVRAEPQAPEYAFQPGQVTISMERYPSLDIQAVGLYVDEKG